MMKKNIIARANRFFADGNYVAAINAYELAILEYPALRNTIDFNIKIAKQKINDEKREVPRADLSKKSKVKRVAIFASYNNKGVVEDYVVWYLKNLKDVCDCIIFIADCNIPASELDDKLSGLVDYRFCERHGEYDFGSYKRGVDYLVSAGRIADFDEIVLCNDSCYGPVNSFLSLFEKMESTDDDFWGLTSNSDFNDHLQSFFLVFRRQVFLSDLFRGFFNGVKAEESVQDVIFNYELKLTSILEDAGFKWSSFIRSSDDVVASLAKINTNLTVFPISLVNLGAELIKVKSLLRSGCNYEGVARTVSFLREANPRLLSMIGRHIDINKFTAAKSVKFSIIMPTYNRSSLIGKAINSALNQSHKNFELVIVDDGSDDNTQNVIISKYKEFIDSGVIVFVRSESRKGVSAARNLGLQVATGDWITYLDSDNELKPNFLSMFYDEIVGNEDSDECLYSAFQTLSDGKPHGREFDGAELLRENFIDLGVFAHKKSILAKSGFFDDSLKRLVDWDFIIRATEGVGARYIPYSLMIYSDNDQDASRISVKESYNQALDVIKKKHSIPYRVSTVILAFNHDKYLGQAIESAAQQEINIPHDIYVFDDASSDGTWDVVCRLAAKYRGMIKGCRQEKNVGQAANLRGAIGAARSDFIAVLEGDDYWSDKFKLQQQVDFLIRNPDCSMVFNKIEIHDIESNKKRFLGRQESIEKERLTAGDFLDHPSMNLIANFSACMFRRHVIEKLPEYAWSDRITEIVCAFHFDKHGYIGYINKAMTVYRQHSLGLWTGAGALNQAISAIKTRLVAERIARNCWRDAIRSDVAARLNSLPQLFKP